MIYGEEIAQMSALGTRGNQSLDGKLYKGIHQAEVIKKTTQVVKKIIAMFSEKFSKKKSNLSIMKKYIQNKSVAC